MGLCPCACVSMIRHCVGACAAVPVLHCVRLALCVVLSLGHILLPAGQASQEPLPGCLEWHHPGGGQRTGAGAAGSGLSTPKIEKETKRIYLSIKKQNYLLTHRFFYAML